MAGEKGLENSISTGSFPVRFWRTIHDNFTEGQVWLEMTSSFLATPFSVILLRIVACRIPTHQDISVIV